MFDETKIGGGSVPGEEGKFSYTEKELDERKKASARGDKPREELVKAAEELRQEEEAAKAREEAAKAEKEAAEAARKAKIKELEAKMEEKNIKEWEKEWGPRKEEKKKAA